jgi:NitT/TauT family transport system permease protein
MARYWSASILVLVALLFSWELAAERYSGVQFFAGSPILIGQSLFQMVQEEEFQRGFFVTAAEAGLGLLIGVGLGSIVGLFAYRYRRIAPLVPPLVLGVGSIPVLAFAPLMIVWFGVGFEMKVALAALTTFFVSFSQALRGARSVSGEHLDILRAMRATEAQLFWKAIVPGSLSWVLGSMRLNAGFCLLGAFVGEFIASSEGLGHIILKASSLYEMPRALAASLGILMLGLLFDGAAQLIELEKDWIAQLLSVPSLLWRPMIRRPKKSRAP